MIGQDFANSLLLKVQDKLLVLSGVWITVREPRRSPPTRRESNGWMPVATGKSFASADWKLYLEIIRRDILKLRLFGIERPGGE